MTKRMLVDATHPEETRVAIVDERRLEDFDFESTGKKQLKGNIYLAKVIRIEPSLQAAFVEYGGNRHGFLPFSEIHPDYFRIPMSDRPHDEEPHEDEGHEDESEDEAALIDAEVQAYRSELADPETPLPAPDEQDHHEHDHHHIEAPLALEATESAPAAETSVAAQAEKKGSAEIVAPAEEKASTEGVGQQAGHVTGLGPESSHELGLITDFGNAAVDPFAAHAAAFAEQPIEIVGGEVAEEVEVERVRRPRARQYKIQEVVKRRQIMLIQVVKEERGNKGAALTTFLSLAGRYCVLMPNTDRGGGVSRKITSHTDRRRMKEILDQLETPEGMAVILRTAGMEQEPAEIQRDLENLLRLWNNIREQTLASTAPTLIYEEANLIKRAMRDLYAADVSEILVAGHTGYQLAHDFMHSIMPEELNKVRLYEDPVPLFFRYNVEKQIDQLYNPVVQLRSGGYIVINPTEALVSIDVNSGRSTRERHIEGTALKTNLEAADEVGRQLRLRDLAGLIVIDFIDMEDGRNNAAVERRMKEAMKSDRARLQIGRISPFGLMELSRQRLHPSLTEINFEKCPHCAGVGMMRSVDSSAISILRMIEEDGIRQSGGEMILHAPTKVALYILNQKRSSLNAIESRYNLQVLLHSDDTLVPPDCRLERVRAGSGERIVRGPAVDSDQILANVERVAPVIRDEEPDSDSEAPPPPRIDGDRNNDRNSRRRGRFGRGGRDRGERGPDRGGERNDRNDRNRGAPRNPPLAQTGDAPTHHEANGNLVPADSIIDDNIGNIGAPDFVAENGGGDASRNDPHRQGGRRRGRRGGRGRRNGHGGERPENGRFDAVATEGEHQEGAIPEAPRPQNGRPERRPDNRDRRPYERNDHASPPITVPVSIHDLDTTPRPHSDTSFAPPPSPYEITNPDQDRPKGGWWRKLTGQ